MDSYALGGYSVAEGNIGFTLANDCRKIGISGCRIITEIVGQVPGNEVIWMNLDESNQVLWKRNRQGPQQ